MNAPKVSILVPAFKPEFLDVCIASALAQTFHNFELVVSDDSTGPDVEAVVSKWSDSRLRYVRNPTRGVPGSNRDSLVASANGEYLKFLHDDDFLYPDALERLAGAADRSGAALVFGWWHVVDQFGRPMSSVTETAKPSEERTFSASEFFEEVIVKGINVIGGPSNVLVGAEAMRSIVEPFGLEGVRMRFLTDVALFTQLVDHGFTIASVGSFTSAYRLHTGQYSIRPGPATSALLFEWELFLRWSLDRGHLNADQYQAGTALQRNHYLTHAESYPELEPFIELGGRAGADGRYLCGEFLRAVALAHEVIDARLAAIERSRERLTEPANDLAAARLEVDELKESWRQAQADLADRESELHALRNTRTFRYTAVPRRLYSRYRHREASS